MNDTRKWGRTGHVRLSHDDGKNWWDSRSNGVELDFEFSIQKPLAAVCMKADITIYGMNREHIDAYSTWTAECLALGLNMRIEVYAGYGDREDCIFSGTIFHAIPTMSPNRALRISARSGWFRNTKPVNGDSNNGTEEDRLLVVEDWFKDTANIIGGDVDLSSYAGDMTKKISQASFENGSTHDTVFRRMYEEARRLSPSAFLMELDAVNGRAQFKVINELVDSDPKNPITISSDNGMVGMPIVRYSDIEVTTLLNPAIVRGEYIKLITKTLRDNGRLRVGFSSEEDSIETQNIYRVYEVKYEGRLRGDKWYATFKAWRFWKTGTKKEK